MTVQEKKILTSIISKIDIQESTHQRGMLESGDGIIRKEDFRRLQAFVNYPPGRKLGLVRQTRIPQSKRFVAIDEIDVFGKIHATPLCFEVGEVVQCIYVDADDGYKRFKVSVTFDGTQLNCIQMDGFDEGMMWEESLSNDLHKIFR